MEIILTPDIEYALSEQAKQLGTTPEELALETLRHRFVSPTQDGLSLETGATLADFLEGYIGVLHSAEHVRGGARMSEATKEALERGLLQKREQNRL